MSAAGFESDARTRKTRVKARFGACPDFGSMPPSKSWINAPAFQLGAQDASLAS
jgi:hypothetical protein